MKDRSIGNVLPAGDATFMHGSMRLLPRGKRGRIVSISLEAITTIEAAGHFTVVHTDEARFMLRESLASLEKSLPGYTFARVNHSLILNIRQIEELQVLGGGNNHVRMKDGRTIALTAQLTEFESLLRIVTN